MADELVEGSIYNQIKAIEGWALTAYQESVKESPNVDVILDNLRKINLQARKIEWRGKGLENLPKGQVADDLKKKVTQLRAAVVTLRDIKKDKDLGNASKRTIRMLSSLATEAVKLVEQFAKGLPDLSKLAKNDIEDFLRGEGNYAAFALDVRRKLWNEFVGKRVKVELSGLNLSGSNLNGFSFSGLEAKSISLSGSNLQKCDFSRAKFTLANFEKSDLRGADFGGAFIQGSLVNVNAAGANFKGAIIGQLSLSGDFSQVDFSSIKGTSNYVDIIIYGDSSFKNANFRDSNVQFTPASNKKNYRISFSNANFRRAYVNISKFINLDQVDFIGADVDGAGFFIYVSVNSMIRKALSLAKGTARISVTE